MLLISRRTRRKSLRKSLLNFKLLSTVQATWDVALPVLRQAVSLERYTASSARPPTHFQVASPLVEYFP